MAVGILLLILDFHFLFDNNLAIDIGMSAAVMGFIAVMVSIVIIIMVCIIIATDETYSFFILIHL